MDWTQTLFDVIDFRSFSNLWFWIVLAVTWSTASHWVLGVPYDLVIRAKRHGGLALMDLQDLVRINVNRILYIGRSSGLVLAGVVGFVHTVLLVLALWYGVELAQALVLLGIPMTIAGILNLLTAVRIEAEAPPPEALFRILARHRFHIQLLGMVSIFFTAMFGMWKNLQVLQGF